MSPDPGTDRYLDGDVVAAVLREQFPEFADASVKYFDEGYDHQLYEVGAEWLFRFPKRSEVVPWFLREVAMMPVIEVVIGVPVPRFEKIGAAGRVFPYPFAGYRRVPGVAADDAERVDRPEVARALGNALSRLHSLDPALVPPAPREDDSWDLRGRDHALGFVPEAVRDEAAAHLRNEVPCPAFPGPACVIHNDLLPEHVLLDPSTGRLTGIIDFADLCLGDPAGDLAALASIGGRGFAGDVLAHYTRPVDNLFIERVRWRTRVLYLEWLADAVAEGSDLDEYQELVALAFTDDYRARDRSASTSDTR